MIEALETIGEQGISVRVCAVVWVVASGRLYWSCGESAW